MPTERESISALKYRDYVIADNEIRAWYDENGALVFVIDYEVNENKQNVLLVINADGKRKWDDILEHDYGVSLEDVRPKQNNKYQKLDIEYSGLEIYDDLIRAYTSGQDVDEKLHDLNQFRNIAVRRAASERLVVAQTLAENTRETIDRTNNSIDELNVKLRDLRIKLAESRKNIGKEPTKQSAAKILRIESQMDAINEKLKRAYKRLDNAQKRLVVATDDADAAREVLTHDETDEVVLAGANHKPIAIMPENKLMVINTQNVLNENEADAIEKPREPEMAEEDVKPLFDQDPEILDEEIAFKPIEFKAPSVPDALEPVSPPPSLSPVPDVPDVYESAESVEPISFVPPVSPLNSEQDMENTEPSVLESITQIQQPEEIIVSEPEPLSNAISTLVPEPVATPAVADTGVRPVSPITGEAPVAVADAGMMQSGQKKPMVVYYALLILLIVVSVFTLWFYQKSTTDNAMPNLGVVTEPEILEPQSEEPELKPVLDVKPESVEIKPEPVIVEPVEEEPEPVVVPVVVEPAPVIEPDVTEPEPVVVDALPVPVLPVEVPVPVMEPEAVYVPEPTIAPQPEPIVRKIETEEEVLAKKPAYGVSQNNAMFVASDAYETDRLSATVPAQEVSAPKDVPSVPVVAIEEPVFVDEFVAEDAMGCEGGASPDRFGCCPGETYTQIDNGGFVCCPDVGGDCFPPLY